MPSAIKPDHPQHNVHKLFKKRLALSTREFKARGHKVVRCDLCRLAQTHCICSLAKSNESQAGFLLLMYDTEVLKPSNTGKLIADVIPDTYAFLWSRTEVDPELIKVLNDPQWQPFLVFPSQYAKDERQVITENITLPEGKRPLFIMLDGSWREAKKMFRKSPYLDKYPMVAFDPANLDPNIILSRYNIRKSAVSNELATAEVAARILSMAGDSVNAQLLDLWFDVFSYQYQKSVCQRNAGDPEAIPRHQAFIKAQGLS